LIAIKRCIGLVAVPFLSRWPWIETSTGRILLGSSWIITASSSTSPWIPHPSLCGWGSKVRVAHGSALATVVKFCLLVVLHNLECGWILIIAVGCHGECRTTQHKLGTLPIYEMKRSFTKVCTFGWRFPGRENTSVRSTYIHLSRLNIVIFALASQGFFIHVSRTWNFQLPAVIHILQCAKKTTSNRKHKMGPVAARTSLLEIFSTQSCTSSIHVHSRGGYCFEILLPLL